MGQRCDGAAATATPIALVWPHGELDRAEAGSHRQDTALAPRRRLCRNGGDECPPGEDATLYLMSSQNAILPACYFLRMMTHRIQHNFGRVSKEKIKSPLSLVPDGHSRPLAARPHCPQDDGVNLERAQGHVAPHHACTSSNGQPCCRQRPRQVV